MSVILEIVGFSREASEREVAAMRRDIEASGMRVLGEPEISRVPNEGYIREPDALADVVVEECDPLQLPGTVIDQSPCGVQKL